MIPAALRAEIESTFQIAKTRCTSEEIVFVCPECADVAGNRSVNLRTGLTNCWRCGKGRHNKAYFLAWAAANGYHFTNAGELAGLSAEELLPEPESERTRVPCVQEVDLPKGFVYLREEPDSAYAMLIGRMAKRKRLTLEDFIEAEAGFTRDDPKWEQFCIFPVKELGRIVYFQGRTYVDVPGQSTKSFPSRREVRHGASCWIYNFDELRQRQAPVAIVVESILNVLSLRKKLRQVGRSDAVPVCVFKHSVSGIQLSKLTACKWLKEMCLMFDADAVDNTWKQTRAMSGITRLTVAEMPVAADNRKLDPNDDVEAAMAAFEARQPYTAGTVLLSEFERVRRMERLSFAAIDLRKHCVQRHAGRG
jgi:hypothetical protein